MICVKFEGNCEFCVTVNWWLHSFVSKVKSLNHTVLQVWFTISKNRWLLHIIIRKLNKEKGPCSHHGFVMCWLQQRLRNTRWGRSTWVRPISGLKTVYGGERDADTPKILLSFSQQVSLLADKPTLSCLICGLWIVDCGLWNPQCGWQQESPGAMTKTNLRIRCHIDLSSAISSF